MARVGPQFSSDDVLTLKAASVRKVAICHPYQDAVTERPEQDLELSHLQAHMWKDTLFEHRFYEIVLIKGDKIIFEYPYVHTDGWTRI